jgi:hypothetical protein
MLHRRRPRTKPSPPPQHPGQGFIAKPPHPCSGVHAGGPVWPAVPRAASAATAPDAAGLVSGLVAALVSGLVASIVSDVMSHIAWDLGPRLNCGGFLQKNRQLRAWFEAVEDASLVETDLRRVE